MTDIANTELPPAMIEAGVDILLKYTIDIDNPAGVVREILSLAFSAKGTAREEVFPNWFKADDVFNVRGGLVFSGPSPFQFDNDENGKKRFFDRPWAISHPDAKKDRFYRVTSVECYALSTIREGSMIGLAVEEIPPPDLTD